jgi:hypothetical protein
MHSELYSDGVGEITITGSIVRLDLVSLSPSERDAHDNPKPVLRQRLIMSLEAFANSVDVMQKALQGLIDAGAVKRKEPREPVPLKLSRRDEHPAAPASEVPQANSSVNFR